MAWSLLEKLPREQADLVLRSSRRRSFTPGEHICYEGEAADTFHVILKGRVAFSSTGLSGEQLTFGISGPDEFFGELALLTADGVRSASVRALEPTETLSIHLREFERLRREWPGVSELLLTILAERVRSLSDRLQEALFVASDERVRRRLVQLAAMYGSGTGPPTVPLSQELLATLAGTSRATVNRVLRQAQERGLVRIGRQRVTILDPKGLASSPPRLPRG
jgi:CRP/FNR family transcriptional regulator, cyclic AMP receptor protein